MNSETGLSCEAPVSDGACLVCVMIRGELAIGAHLRAANLYSVGPFGS